MALANLTDRQIEEVKEMFSLFDTNHDGRITSAELGKVLKRFNQSFTDKDLEMLVKEIDFNDSGTIELTEFIQIIESRKETVDLEDAMLEAFNVFDKDGDGYIDRFELKEVMSNLGNDLSDDVIDDMVRQADMDGDGRINFDEFIHLWNEYL